MLVILPLTAYNDRETLPNVNFYIPLQTGNFYIPDEKPTKSFDSYSTSLAAVLKSLICAAFISY
jgi:hypothetical protein